MCVCSRGVGMWLERSDEQMSGVLCVVAVVVCECWVLGMCRGVVVVVCESWVLGMCRVVVVVVVVVCECWGLRCVGWWWWW